jgi:endoglucanase
MSGRKFHVYRFAEANLSHRHSSKLPGPSQYIYKATQVSGSKSRLSSPTTSVNFSQPSHSHLATICQHEELHQSKCFVCCWVVCASQQHCNRTGCHSAGWKREIWFDSNSTSFFSRTNMRSAGVNIAGFDFGCGTDGTCNPLSAVPPIAGTGGDGAGQMAHFVKDDHFNIFRLPVGWQYLTGGTPNAASTLNSGNLQKYDQLMQSCLNSASTTVCILDIHNYARLNGQIIGQGGPSNAEFVALWTQLATKYKGQSRIAFGLMNEPHDVDITKWAVTVQAVVTAIRNAGATSQMSKCHEPL